MNKRILALLLAATLLFSLLPTLALAEDEQTSEESALTEPVEMTAEPEAPADTLTEETTEETEQAEEVATDSPVASGSCGENLTWTLVEDGLLTISGTGEMADYAISEAPWYSYIDSITSAIIESGVTSIGDFAFVDCSNLTSITIPNSVTSLGKGAFYCCCSLTSINIPGNVTSISSRAFANCSSLTSVTIPNSVTSIDGEAFFCCSSLTSIAIPESVTSIGEWAFSYCSSLTEISVASENSRYCSVEGVLFDKSKTTLLYYPVSKPGTTYLIPDTVTDISHNAFAWNENLTSVTIPNSVTSIGEGVFIGCSKLTSITIPGSVNSIGGGAFFKCISLEKIIFVGNAPLFDSEAFASITAVVSYPANDDTWTEEVRQSYGGDITWEAFDASDDDIATSGICGENLTWTLDEDGLLTISGTGEMYNYSYNNAADWPYSVRNVVIEPGVTSIGDRAFGRGSDVGFYSLTSVNIPDSVTSIGVTAFLMCSSLQNLTIPKGVTSIGSGAFAYCGSLERITFVGSAPAFGDGVFSEVTATAYYPGDNDTWTEQVRQSYDGDITWQAYKCCGISENGELVTAPEHDWSDGAVTTEPTCTSKGVKTYICIVCGETKTEEIDALGHTEVIDPAVEPTCTEAGTTAGKHCSVCGEVLVKQEVVAALGHSWNDGAVTSEPTCTSKGVKTFTCTRCGETKTEEIDALGHTEVIDAAVEPTCTEAGKTEGKHCSVCKEVLVKQEVVAALGHTEVIDTAVEPTCTEAGKTAGKHCSVCKEVLVAQEVVAALGHTEVIDAAVEPTCTEAGKTAGKHCSVCGDVLVAQEEIAALGHSWNDGVVTTEPTCASKGVKTFTCTRCGETKTEELATIEHTEEIDPAVEPTCTETGLTEGKHCSVCKEVLVKQEVVAALGHSWNDGVVTTAPTCTSKGVKTFTCTRCGATKTEDIAALGHSWNNGVVTTAPTCTSKGVKTFTCTRCGATKTEDIAALGHSWNNGVVTTEPTCTSKGVKTFTCTRCGETKTEEIDALGHTEVIDAAVEPTCTETGLTEGKHCSVCKEVLVKQEVVAALGHTEVIDAAVAPTCTEAGKTEGKHCSVCNEVLVAQEVVAALGHTEVIDAAVEPTCTEAGKTEGKHCSVCNEVLAEQEEIAALGHTEVIDAAVEPTCTEAGKTEGKHCSVCEEVLVAQEEIAALGHSWNDGVCTVCGNVKTVVGTSGLGSVEYADGTAFEPDIELVIAPQTASESTKTALEKKSIDKYEVFDISLYRNGVKIQPDGKLKVSLDVPSGFEASRCVVYRQEADGNLTNMNATLVSGKLSFVTDHLSTYIIAQQPVSTSGSTDSTNPKTGDEANMLRYAALAMLGLCCTVSLSAVTMLRKKEN